MVPGAPRRTLCTDSGISSTRAKVESYLKSGPRGAAAAAVLAAAVVAVAVLEDEGRTLVTDVRIDRVFLINGLFYGVEGMCVGGTRRLRISPQLGYGEKGLPGVIPPNSVLNAEVTILEEHNA